MKKLQLHLGMMPTHSTTGNVVPARIRARSLAHVRVRRRGIDLRQTQRGPGLDPDRYQELATRPLRGELRRKWDYADNAIAPPPTPERRRRRLVVERQAARASALNHFSLATFLAEAPLDSHGRGRALANQQA